MRTRPLVEPIDVRDTNGGIFMDCRFVSDNEPERRVWKMTVRTDTSRGELVHQSQFEIPASTSIGNDKPEWKRVMVPFDSFRQVRGPRIVLDGPKLNVTAGIYQIGMTMSKFIMNENLTTIDNFRPGFFNLELERIGLYAADAVTDTNPSSSSSSSSSSTAMVSLPVKTLSAKEAERKRPLLLKLLLPVAKLFFSEEAQRRKSALKILMEKRGFSRWGAIAFGMRSRANTIGWIPSIMKTTSIVSIDMARFCILKGLRLCVIFPVAVIRKIIQCFQNILSRPRNNKDVSKVGSS